MLGFIFPLPVLFDEGVSTDTLLTLCLLTQAGSAPACGNTIYLLFGTKLILSLEDVDVVIHHQETWCELDQHSSEHWPLRTESCEVVTWWLISEIWYLRTRIWGRWLSAEHMPFCEIKINRWEVRGLEESRGRTNEGVWPGCPPQLITRLSLCGPPWLLERSNRQHRVTVQGKHQQSTDIPII